MAGFAMCAACRAEYEDPGDRRFHAEPNACPACGPRARLLDAAGESVAVEVARDMTEEAQQRAGVGGGSEAVDAVGGAAGLLRGGAIVAVKGLGGYHLACLAGDEAAVAALRARKQREEKPFALLVADLAAARELVELGIEEEALLGSRARPIVLAPRLPGAPRRRRGGAALARARADAARTRRCITCSPPTSGRRWC